MTRARTRALAILCAALVVAGIAAAIARRSPPAPPQRPAAQRPALLLLTSLPLIFPEQFTLRGGGSAALTALERRYKVVPIGAADGAELAKGRLLLMAHAPAQTAENLVVLDSWVRRGGRLLLLADPSLEWPSERPLGDPLRPAPMFTDTGLLAHWGVRLSAPAERGRVRRRLADYEIVTDSPGAVAGSCAISADALVADCRIGHGRAIVVADADLLDADRLGSDARHNLDAVLAALADLEKD